MSSHRRAGIDGFCLSLSLTTFMTRHKKCDSPSKISSHRSWILPKADDLRDRASQMWIWFLPKADDLCDRASQMWLFGWYSTHSEVVELVFSKIYGYRMPLWAENTATIEQFFERPESLECVRWIRVFGEHNWLQYMADEVTEIRGHLLKYPIEIDRTGKVKLLHGGLLACNFFNFPFRHPVLQAGSRLTIFSPCSSGGLLKSESKLE
ncbi:hypothetical protein T459_06489 [Capsicum annuum]|uniref:Phospholipase D C-terminal domain-containing protein n=1 Tax=Capsicum annuum TaxID=4072 RepID=A0A2G3AAV2_CAPAN|nr:hypothetical protein T459_06489 [Capsicum annuum]